MLYGARGLLELVKLLILLASPMGFEPRFSPFQAIPILEP